MKNNVSIRLEKTIGENTTESEKSFFFTEAHLKEKNGIYYYFFDESLTSQSGDGEPSLIEVGSDYVSRIIGKNGDNSILYKEGVTEKIVHETPFGDLISIFSTILLDINLEDGIGDIEIIYKYESFETNVMNYLNIHITRISE
ncbi:MAG: hypothetical protein CSB16_00580 [Clostridiales bacterium]|nr:MAG: hypothetical protein CSB16_00580 [Clostridiales bacterium]